MKNTLYPRFVIPSLFVGSLVLGSLLQAQTYQVDDWYVVAPNATSVTNGDTATATINYNTSVETPRYNAQQTYIWSYFDEVALNDGDAIRFSAMMSVDYVTGANGDTGGLRFGLFNSAATHPTERVTEAEMRNGWDGGVFINTGSNIVYRKDAPNTTAFIVTSNTTQSTLNSAVSNHRFADMVSVELVFELTRSGNNLIIGGSFADSAIAGTFTDYFSEGTSNTFDAFGFFVGSQGVNGATNSITFSNARVEVVVPEPALFSSLLGVAALAGVVFYRRRCRTR